MQLSHFSLLGNVYFADQFNQRIRKVTASLTGSPRYSYFVFIFPFHPPNTALTRHRTATLRRRQRPPSRPLTCPGTHFYSYLFAIHTLT